MSVSGGEASALLDFRNVGDHRGGLLLQRVRSVELHCSDRRLQGSELI